MDESRLPWWLVVLLGVWVIALTVWQSSRWKPEIRWRAGGLSLVYLGLLVFALFRDPRPVTSASDAIISTRWNAAEIVRVLASLIAITAALFILAGPSRRGGLIWFAVLSLANAAICFASGAMAAAVGLGLLAMAGLIPLARKNRRRGYISLRELLPETRPAAIHAFPFSPLLVGATGFALAILLVGTVRYSLRAEASRATASRRYSALPTATRIHSVLGTDVASERSTTVLDLATGRRADVVVLLAVLTFVSLASTMSTKPDSNCNEAN
jgi:hypothetical protein